MNDREERRNKRESRNQERAELMAARHDNPVSEEEEDGGIDKNTKVLQEQINMFGAQMEF